MSPEVLRHVYDEEPTSCRLNRGRDPLSCVDLEIDGDAFSPEPVSVHGGRIIPGGLCHSAYLSTVPS